MGSMCCRLMDHSLSQLIRLTACGQRTCSAHSKRVEPRTLLAPWEMMNSRSAEICMPRRSTPRMVGKRGSSQLSTRFVSTNHCSLRLLSTVYIRFKRLFASQRVIQTVSQEPGDSANLKSQMCGFRMPSASMIQ